ncbi:MAG: HAMP domain-containing protein [Alkalinema sp. RU_4_3]|nr:HAMP domain-containing protein [Alkalinema sp. RU_4_3]
MPHLFPFKFNELSLRQLLSIAFAGQILAAGGLIGYLAFRESQVSAEDLAQQILVQTSNHVLVHLEDYTKILPAVLETNHNALDNGVLKLDRLADWRQHLFGQAKVNKMLGYIYFGKADGEYVEVRQYSTRLFRYGSGPKQPNKVTLYNMDDQGRLGSFIKSLTYDPRWRPWYKSALSNSKPHWTSIYTFKEEPPTLGISFVQAYRTDQGIQGVFGADFVLLDTNSFLQQLKILKTGRVFIVEPDGNLVASSSPEAPSRGNQRIQPAGLNDPLIQGADHSLKAQFSSYSQLPDQANFTFEIDHRRQHGRIARFKDAYGLDWRVVVVVPASDFLGRIEESRQRSMFWGLGILGFSLVNGLLLARWIARPIAAVSKASDNLAVGDFCQINQTHGLKEVHDLERSFNHMSHQLEQAQTQLQAANTSLEARVQERTQELETEVKERQQANQALQATLLELKTTQQQLIQAAKLATLGSLIASVAHEMNSPLGAIRSAADNLSSVLQADIMGLPEFLLTLSSDHREMFLTLLEQSILAQAQLTETSTREQRQLRRQMLAQLKAAQIEDADTLADTLVDLGISEQIDRFAPLMQSDRRQEILEAAYNLTSSRRSLDTIGAATESAEKVIGALRSYIQRETQRERIAIDLVASIDRTLTIYRNAFKRGIKLVRQYPENLPLVSGYAEDLNQIWSNLVSNALGSMIDRGTLTVRIAPQAQGERAGLQVTIEDTGPGIPESLQPHLFEPFVTGKVQGEGLGLGLNIAYNAVQNHQGLIHFTTKPGQTAMVVWLPCQAP